MSNSLSALSDESFTKKARTDFKFLSITPKEISCAQCSSPNPWGFWVYDDVTSDQYLCQLCYAKAYTKTCNLITESIHLARCNACLPSFKHGSTVNRNCKECALIEKNAPKYACGSCSSTTSAGAWFRAEGNAVTCQNCYHAINRIRVDNTLDGNVVQRTCVSCLTFKSTSWYRDGQILGRYICKQCYNHRYQNKSIDQLSSPRACMLLTL